MNDANKKEPAEKKTHLKLSFLLFVLGPEWHLIRIGSNDGLLKNTIGQIVHVATDTTR